MCQKKYMCTAVIIVALWGIAHGADRNVAVALGAPTSAIQAAHGTNGVQQGELQKKPVRRRSFAGLSEREMWQAKPRMFKSTGFPKTEEEYLMWDWRDAMEKVDRNYARKMPIEFFGQVVDQYTNPVASAQVRLSWSVEYDNEERLIKSGPDGRFEIRGIRGRALSVRPSKDGYFSGKKYRKAFDYADFSRDNFHVPNPTNPVVFTLWKYENPEPMFKLNTGNVDLPIDNTIVWMSVETGARVAETGHVGFSVLRTDTTNWLAGYTITVHAAAGGGLRVAESGDDLMFVAPEQGYERQIRTVQPPGDHLSGGKGMRFFLRTSDGRYAALTVEMCQYNTPKRGAAMCALIYYNPSGSRNLQYRDDLCIREKRW